MKKSKNNHLSKYPKVNRPTTPSIVEFSTGNENLPLEVQQGVFRDKLIITHSMILPILGIRKGWIFKDNKQYWAKTEEEINFINQFEEIYSLLYISGLINPTNSFGEFPQMAKDGYELHVIGKLKD